MKVTSSKDRPVLICVDDDEQLLETIEFLLGKHFPTYRIVACLGGQDALEQIEELARARREVQLVLSDQVMPEMTGIELLARVPGVYPDAIRIVLTGQAGLQSAIDAIKEGVDDYLEKPLSELELVKTIRNHLNNYLLRQENRRLQELVRQSRRRTSEITDYAFRQFNTHLTRLLSGQGDRAEITANLRRARENLSLLSNLYRIDDAIEGGAAWSMIDLGELARDSIALLAGIDGRKLFEARDLAVDLINYEEGESLVSNRAAVRIVLERLLENAANHAPVGSTVTVTLRGPRFDRSRDRPDPRLLPEIVDLVHRGFFVVSVRDNGIPTREDAEQLTFLQSWGGERPRSDRLSGLGLAIASEYLLLVSGQLIVDVEADRQGTEVHAAFPNQQRGPAREA